MHLYHLSGATQLWKSSKPESLSMRDWSPITLN